MDTSVRQFGLDRVKDVGAQLARISQLPPPEFSFEELRWIHAQLIAARQNFALTAAELDSIGALIEAWQRAELQAGARRVAIARLGNPTDRRPDPQRLVELLRGMAPQAEILLEGPNITINRDVRMSLEEVEDRLRRDPKWLSKKLRVDRPRARHADKPLVVSTDADSAVEAAGTFSGDGVADALAPLRAALGDRAFAGLVADLADTPQALGELLPVVDMERLAQVATLIGPDAVAGVMVECRASPGRFVTFINGVLARRSEVQEGLIEEIDDDEPPGRLDGAKVLDASLALAMHRVSLPPDARGGSIRDSTTCR